MNRTRIKKTLSRWMLNSIRHDMLSASDMLSPLLWHAFQLRYAEIEEETFCQSFEQWLASSNPDDLKAAAGLPDHISRLLAGGYKSTLFSLPDQHKSMLPWLWSRRFRLLAHHGISLDVMILRQGQTIPPHGHIGIVSGFYVLDGEVALRNYEKIQTLNDGLLIRNAFSGILKPGGFTVNGDCRPNIHWIEGVAAESILFRLNIKGVPSPLSAAADNTPNARIYIDPCVNASTSDEFFAPYISDSDAKALRMQH